MRPNLRILSRYRPRILSLCVVGIVAALIVLANLSVEVRRRGAPRLARRETSIYEKQTTAKHKGGRCEICHLAGRCGGSSTFT